MERLTDGQLLDLVNDIESDRVERKQSFRGDTPDKARQAVCAFANDLPNHNSVGLLFIGLCDDGSPSGEPVTDELLRSLADMKTDGAILPLPVMTVEKRNIKGTDVAVVTVTPSDMPPVKYKGRIWIRTGPRRDIAGEQDERILSEKRRFKNLPYDLYPVPAANIADMSRKLFEFEYLPLAFAPDVLEENNRTFEERLASLKMIVSPSDATPTVSGLLAIGKNPQDFIHGACIQFLRIGGALLTDPILDEEKIGGAIAEMLRRAEEKIKAHNMVAMDVTSSATHKIYADYPVPAVLQILYNAVLHRTYERTNAPVRLYWYDDRIEITSPGGAFGNVTRDNFGKPGIMDYRNPNLGAIMKTLGFVQSFGRGIAIARAALEKNGNPPIEFTVDPDAVLCVIRK
jgi:ATP-dependent DNA helicase RecG